MSTSKIQFSGNAFNSISKQKKVEVNEWEPITKKRIATGTYSGDHISARIKLQKTKTIISTYYIDLSIGQNLCEMLGWQPKDHIKIMAHCIDKHILKLQKTENKYDGYALGAPPSHVQKRHLKFKIDQVKNITCDHTVDVPFDLLEDSIIIDLKEIYSE